MNLDLEAIRKIPEMASQINQHEELYSRLKTELADDVERFSDKAESVLSRRNTAQEDLLFDNSWSEIQAAFDRYLRPWFDARNKLSSEQLHLAIDQTTGSLEVRRAKAMRGVIGRIKMIRRIYATLEIVVPVLFAAFAIIYVNLY